MRPPAAHEELPAVLLDRRGHGLGVFGVALGVGDLDLGDEIGRHLFVLSAVQRDRRGILTENDSMTASDDTIRHREHEGRGEFYIEREGRRVGELTYSSNSGAMVV